MSAVMEDEFLFVEFVNGQSVSQFFVTSSKGASLIEREITLDLFELVGVLGARMFR